MDTKPQVKSVPISFIFFPTNSHLYVVFLYVFTAAQQSTYPLKNKYFSVLMEAALYSTVGARAWLSTLAPGNIIMPRAVQSTHEKWEKKRCMNEQCIIFPRPPFPYLAS